MGWGGGVAPLCGQVSRAGWAPGGGQGCGPAGASQRQAGGAGRGLPRLDLCPGITGPGAGSHAKVSKADRSGDGDKARARWAPRQRRGRRRGRGPVGAGLRSHLGPRWKTEAAGGRPCLPGGRLRPAAPPCPGAARTELEGPRGSGLPSSAVGPGRPRRAGRGRGSWPPDRLGPTSSRPILQRRVQRSERNPGTRFSRHLPGDREVMCDTGMRPAEDGAGAPRRRRTPDPGSRTPDPGRPRVWTPWGCGARGAAGPAPPAPCRHRRLAAGFHLSGGGGWCCWGDRRRSSDRRWTGWFSLCAKYLEMDSSALSGHRSKGLHCRHEGTVPKSHGEGTRGSLAADFCAGEDCQTQEPGRAPRGRPFASTE